MRFSVAGTAAALWSLWYVGVAAAAGKPKGKARRGLLVSKRLSDYNILSPASAASLELVRASEPAFNTHLLRASSQHAIFANDQIGRKLQDEEPQAVPTCEETIATGLYTEGCICDSFDESTYSGFYICGDKFESGDEWSYAYFVDTMEDFNVTVAKAIDENEKYEGYTKVFVGGFIQSCEAEINDCICECEVGVCPEGPDSFGTIASVTCPSIEPVDTCTANIIQLYYELNMLEGGYQCASPDDKCALAAASGDYDECDCSSYDASTNSGQYTCVYSDENVSTSDTTYLSPGYESFEWSLTYPGVGSIWFKAENTTNTITGTVMVNGCSCDAEVGSCPDDSEVDLIGFTCPGFETVDACGDDTEALFSVMTQLEPCVSDGTAAPSVWGTSGGSAGSTAVGSTEQTTGSTEVGGDTAVARNNDLF